MRGQREVCSWRGSIKRPKSLSVRGIFLSSQSLFFGCNFTHGLWLLKPPTWNPLCSLQQWVWTGDVIQRWAQARAKACQITSSFRTINQGIWASKKMERKDQTEGHEDGVEKMLHFTGVLALLCDAQPSAWCNYSPVIRGRSISGCSTEEKTM